MELATAPRVAITGDADRVIERHLADGRWPGPILLLSDNDMRPATSLVKVWRGKTPGGSQLLGVAMPDETGGEKLSLT